MKKFFTQTEFEFIQQKYNRMYLELYKKYFNEKVIISKARSKIETMFANGNEEKVLDDLIELYDILDRSKYENIIHRK